MMHHITRSAVAAVAALAASVALAEDAKLPAEGDAVYPYGHSGAWYVFADPGSIPVLEYAYLSSAQGPQIASREGFDVLGIEFRVVLDFGAGALDWRGAYLNEGE